MSKDVSAPQRAMNFNSATRRHTQVIASKTSTSGNEVLNFVIPKNKLLSKLRLRVGFTMTNTHASITDISAVLKENAPFSLFKLVELVTNGNFIPFRLTGYELAQYNKIENGVDKALFDRASSGRGLNVMPIVASSGGTANTCRFSLDLPLTLNPNSPQGLVLAGNDSTLIELNVTLGGASDLADGTGYTIALSGITVSLAEEIFSIPANDDAKPDLSTLKVVKSKTETLINGENNIQLEVGNIYRGIGIIVSNATPVRADNITGKIEMVVDGSIYIEGFNVQDVIDQNTRDYNGVMDTGVYWLDFSRAGIRDWVNTENSTEFLLKFTTSAAGSCKIITEAINILKLTA